MPTHSGESVSIRRDEDSIPLIDLQHFLDGTNKTSVVEQVTRACQEIGFFAVANHGVDPEVVDTMFLTSRAFFDLPPEEKRKSMSNNAAEYPFGYEESENLVLAKTGKRSLADLKETFSIGPSNPKSGMPARRIPSQPPGFEEALTLYYGAIERLAASILEIMALGLGLPPHWFAEKMDHHVSALRLLNYPNLAAPAQPGQLRAGAHTDYGAVTILKSGGPGLQVKRDDGIYSTCWVDVPTFDSQDVFVINLGDMMQRWTNDKWVSTLHRVLVPPFDGKDHRRQSIAFFVNMNADAMVETIETCIDSEHPAKYKPVAAGEYVIQKYLTSMGEAKQ